MSGRDDKEKAPADAGAVRRGNLEGYFEELRARQLREGERGNVAEAREAHAAFSEMIGASNIPQPYRDWLAWMHGAIANGMDARDACAVRPKRGQFSKLRRDIALWRAIGDIAFEDGTDWHAAAEKLHSRPEMVKRLRKAHPDLELPRGRNHERSDLETIKNIYRRVDADMRGGDH